MRGTAVAVVVLAVLTAGCQDTPNSNGNGTVSPTVTESTGEPPLEPTTPETTGAPVDKPSLSIATAPVGGAPDNDDVEQCASVSWLGDKIPAGTTIELGSPRLEPEGIFELDQSICSGSRACPGVVWDNENQDSCSVGGRQVSDAEKSVNVIIPATAICETEQDCADLKAGLRKGTQVAFVARQRETPTTETPATESPSNGTPSSETPPNG